MVEAKGEGPLGFPGNCLTNAYLLEGFAQIVYIVSTVAGGSINTGVSIISRLRNAEKELRAQSLLVSLDTDTNELFTFHRLIDFQKDGKNIYGRLAMVLRHNQCIISFKSGLKVAALMKSEHARLKAILLMAVFSALKPSLVSEGNLLPLGMRSFLRLGNLEETQDSGWLPEDDRKNWQLEVIDLQLLAHGQILVVNTSHKADQFEVVSDYLAETLERKQAMSLRPGFLCLSPTGQMARYTDGEVFACSNDLPEPNRPGTARSDRQAAHIQSSHLKAWKEAVLAWLAEFDIHDPGLSKGYWVEIDIPFSRKAQQDNSDAIGNEAERFTWKRILWPAALCFYFQRSLPASAFLSDIPIEDPVAFVQDWLLKSDERTRKLSQNLSKGTEHADDVDMQVGENTEEDLGFGSTPQMHNAFAAGLLPSQTMYPTPPDVPYTQATPGMSSIDGIGMTPAETTKPMPSLAEHQTEDDIIDHIGASGVGTGTYDEDLFEDLPHDRFGGLGATDEPDWGFFEQQNAEVSSMHSQNDHVQSMAQNTPAETEIPPQDTEMTVGGYDTSENSMLPPVIINQSSTQAKLSSSLQEAKEVHMTEVGFHPDLKTSDEEVPSQGPVDAPMESPKPHPAAASSSLEQAPQVEIWKKPALPVGRGRRRSLYDSLEVLSTAADLDERYSANGTFWFDPPSENQPILFEEINKSKYPSLDISNPALDESSESDSSSFYQVDSMDVDEMESMYAKRKWTEYEQGSSASYLGPTMDELEQIKGGILEVLQLLRPTTLDHTWIIGDDNNMLNTLAPLANLDEAMMTAQILVDQLAQTSIPYDEFLVLQRGAAEMGQPANLGALDAPHGRMEPATLANLLKNTENDSQPDPVARLDSLQRHQLCVLRTDKNLSVSVTALSLWENLNLQPNGGRKDIQAYCVHPASANVEAGCDVLLERMTDIYTACNLGDHSIGQIAGISNNGLVSCSDHDEAMPTLRQCCERLGTALARLPPTSNNVIVYMIAASGLDMSPIVLVEAFCVLFDAYLKACNKQHPIELALQIIPIDFIASPDTLVLRPPQDYLKLAIEVYNRFPPNTLGDKPGLCGSAIVLSESPRRRIRFDIGGPVGATSEIGAQCLHLAYSFSENGRWIVAAWSDERGYRALTMCYSFKLANNGATRTRLEIISDMWEVSQDLMAKERRRWRLVVARNGFYDTSEVNDWATQFNQSADTSKCSPLLVSVDLDPILNLQTPKAQARIVQGGTPSQPGQGYGTPVSTPQASTTSPDQYLTATPTPSGSALMNAATPPEVTFDPNSETEVTVQDPTEESWSVVLPFGLNQSRAVLESRPALLSGILLKRQGARDEDGLCKLGVSLIHSSAPSAAVREEILKDILGQYRGLVTLSRTRGCIDPVHDVVPWHVATAVKGARVLDRWM